MLSSRVNKINFNNNRELRASNLLVKYLKKIF